MSTDRIVTFPFDNSYARLPDHFYARVSPSPVSEPKLIRLNNALATELGLDLDHLRSAEGIAVLAGNLVPHGADPIAMAYAGHQFGYFVPQLGDGRAILIGEIIGRDGQRRDIQLKGSGRTPFSRSGDGRAALGPVLREYIVSEAFAALGIPTTRSLAAVLTGDYVLREMPLPGAILTRIALSHVRVGTFQYFAARNDIDGLRTLADYVIARHYPECTQAHNRYRSLLDVVISKQATLVARWLLIGFIHGVMNTDNMSIAGETIDFGPCAFMDAFDPDKVFSSIDQMGRYAYANQPRIALWNLARFAETLLPLISEDEATALKEAHAALDAFLPQFDTAYTSGMRAKLGICQPQPEDLQLSHDLLQVMSAEGIDFTVAFRQLNAAASGADSGLRAVFKNHEAINAWIGRWRARLLNDNITDQSRSAMMRKSNPAYIPRNHRIEQAIRAAVDQGDFQLFHRLVEVLANPFDERPENAIYADPPKPEEVVQQTYCGT